MSIFCEGTEDLEEQYPKCRELQFTCHRQGAGVLAGSPAHGREIPRGLWSKKSGTNWAGPQSRVVFTAQFHLPRVWISPAILYWALGTSTLPLNNPPTIPVLPSPSLLWAPATALHLFSGFPFLSSPELVSGSCVGSPESGNLESRGDGSLCHCLEVFHG